MYKKPMLFITLMCLICCWLYAAVDNRAVLVHNTLAEINANVGKLQLQLVRVWGGENEEDENKFFRSPSEIRIDGKGLVYICDTDNHHIQVFTAEGAYLRTIGRVGWGPGDCFQPFYIGISPGGDLWVHEMGGRRMQRFSPDGKSNRIFKNPNINMLVGVTRREELLVYNHRDTLDSGRLISFLDEKGKVLRKIGQYDDPSKDWMTSERYFYATDEQDNIYVANIYSPVIRKYNTNGQLVLVITTEPPFKVPYHITMNAQGNDIIRVDMEKSASNVSGNYKKGKGGIIYFPDVPQSIMSDFSIDAQMRIYALLSKRRWTEKELNASITTSSTKTGTDYSQLNYSVLDNLEVTKLVTFSPQGKVIAAVDLKGLNSSVYVHEDHLFIMDNRNQQITEYKMKFTQ